jgi:DNA-binding CsgD family transcriptional regulator
MLLALEREQVDAAKADYEALVAGDMRHIPFDAYWFGVVIPLTRAAIAFGDQPRMSRLYAMLEPYADRLGFVGILGVSHSPVSLYLGQLATAMRRWDDAERWFSQALAHAERLGLRPSIVRALLSEAEMRAERAAPGDVDVARGLARRAADAATAIGMAGLVPRIEALLDRLSPGRADHFGLTPRELEVLQLVASGLTDVAIADRLFLSRRTVNSHLTSIYTKLGVSSRTAATRIAIEYALI